MLEDFEILMENIWFEENDRVKPLPTEQEEE